MISTCTVFFKRSLPAWFFCFCVALLLSGCDYKRYNYDFFEGNWVMINYLDTVQKYRSLVKADHLPMQEIVLRRHVDSVMIIENGITTIFPFIRKGSNNIEIGRYKNDQPLELHISENADYLKYKKNGKWHVFVKPDELLVDSSEDFLWPRSGQRVIRSIVLGGVYKMKDHEVPVQFYTNGTISGLGNFDFYEVCISGDCRSAYAGDVLYMSNGNQGAYYTWSWDKKDLAIYELEQVNKPGEKIAYKKGIPVLSLHKLR